MGDFVQPGRVAIKAGQKGKMFTHILEIKKPAKIPFFLADPQTALHPGLGSLENS